MGDVVDTFVQHLKTSIESTAGLQKGEAFLPAGLQGSQLSKQLFSPVVSDVALTLGWSVQLERHIPFPKEYEVWNAMRVDYSFYATDRDQPMIYLELETLDRAQLYNFLPRKNGDSDASKLWHWYGIVANHLTKRGLAPSALIFLLVLPDEPVSSYQVWDVYDAKLFDTEIRQLIYLSPFRVYDSLIKAAAQLFLERRMEFPTGGGDWKTCTPKDFQEVCELVFVTVTRAFLVVARGKEGFVTAADKRYPLLW
jgi:hypothetical protein